jgi:GNAT superfamily N-acetyltransferase
MEIHFLEGHPNFIPQLAAWCHEEWKDFYGGKTVEDVRAYFAANTSRDRLPITYVAAEEGRLCGTVTLDVEDLDLRGYEDVSPWLVCLYVEKAHRGRGLGRQLIHHAMDEALRLKLSSLHLWTENLEPMYLQLGWRVLERTQFHGHEITVMRRDFN